MKKDKLLIFLSTILVFVSCGQNSSKEIDYKRISASDGSYSVEIPSYLEAQKVNDMISFQNEHPQAIGLIKLTSQEDYKNETEKTMEQKGFSYSELERTDTTLIYKVSKGMFSAYEMYRIKHINDNMYLIKFSSSDNSQRELSEIINHISSSFKITKKETTQVPQTKSAKESGSDELKTYTKSTYSIKYPRTWKVVENVNAMTEAYIGSETENIGFTIVRFPTDESLATIIQEGNEELRNTGAKILSSKTVKIGKYSCNKSESEISVSGVKARHLSYTFKEKGVLYNVKFGNVTTSEQRILCEKIITTFKIKQ